MGMMETPSSAETDWKELESHGSPGHATHVCQSLLCVLLPSLFTFHMDGRAPLSVGGASW